MTWLVVSGRSMVGYLQFILARMRITPRRVCTSVGSMGRPAYVAQVLTAEEVLAKRDEGRPPPPAGRQGHEVPRRPCCHPARRLQARTGPNNTWLLHRGAVAGRTPALGNVGRGRGFAMTAFSVEGPKPQIIVPFV